MEIKAGQIVTLKPELLDPGAENVPHVAIEDSWRGSVRVTAAADIPGMRFKPINDWRLEWIAEPVGG